MDVVIGAGFGDEGKGLITHSLADPYGDDALVVRFNGGAQAGHTVVMQDGRRHVFHHLGSGTFSGATTFLSKFFVSNPILFLEEFDELQMLGVEPKVIVDPDSSVTTPYDMIVNQIVEEDRGESRHGSCGVGFGETIERNLNLSYSLKVADLEHKQKTISIIDLIRKKWLPERLNELGVNDISSELQSFIDSDDVFHKFIQDITLFSELVTVARLDLTSLSSPVIFEGAQGLMLDQDKGWFPHVTRSRTGLANVSELIQSKNNETLNVTYVTRAYLTRHGAGPLPHELPGLPYPGVMDKTNVTHKYQGDLRYAWLNFDLLNSFIHSDLSGVDTKLKVNTRLAVTCLDQIDDEVTFVDENKIHHLPEVDFLRRLALKVKVAELFCSFGPTSQTLTPWRALKR